MLLQAESDNLQCLANEIPCALFALSQTNINVSWWRGREGTPLYNISLCTWSDTNLVALCIESTIFKTTPAHLAVERQALWWSEIHHRTCWLSVPHHSHQVTKSKTFLHPTYWNLVSYNVGWTKSSACGLQTGPVCCTWTSEVLNVQR